MKELLSYVLSPAGLALYALFWAFKLVFGAWLLRKLSDLLPDVVSDWIGERIVGLKLRLRGSRRAD